jgi:hypothetical protein
MGDQGKPDKALDNHSEKPPFIKIFDHSGSGQPETYIFPSFHISCVSLILIVFS